MRPSPSVLLVKRLIDIFIGLIGTLALLAFYPFLALLIKLESPGPVLYGQERVGTNKRSRRADGTVEGEGHASRVSDVGGRPFKVYKFRSMRIDAEKNG